MRVNLDTLPEAIRRFLLALSESPDHVVLESAGRAVAQVIPLTAAVVSTPSGGWTAEMNRRRCELIDRKYDGGISPVEAAELALLQDAMDRCIDRVAPLPLDGVRQLHQDLLQKVAAVEAANGRGS